MKQEFEKYKELLLEWNEKINLTAITDPEEIRVKHFEDSLTVLPYLSTNGATLADIGTGAGFPGIPIAIERPDLQITLVDSLEKRINFLNAVIAALGLKNVQTVHARAEDFGQARAMREHFDYAIARAVAPMNILLEYTLPLVKPGGEFIAMKGANAEKFGEYKNALELLGGAAKSQDEFVLPGTDITRNIIVVSKVFSTPAKYPRKAGTPSRKPL